MKRILFSLFLASINISSCQSRASNIANDSGVASSDSNKTIQTYKNAKLMLSDTYSNTNFRRFYYSIGYNDPSDHNKYYKLPLFGFAKAGNKNGEGHVYIWLFSSREKEILAQKPQLLKTMAPELRPFWLKVNVNLPKSRGEFSGAKYVYLAVEQPLEPRETTNNQRKLFTIHGEVFEAFRDMNINADDKIFQYFISQLRDNSQNKSGDTLNTEKVSNLLRTLNYGSNDIAVHDNVGGNNSQFISDASDNDSKESWWSNIASPVVEPMRQP